MAGYSGTPLVQKIGIKPGHRVVLRNHPASFVKDLGRLPENAETSEKLSGKANVIVYFTDKRAALEKDFSSLSSALVTDGMLWVSWPKKASGKATDLNENIVREIGLERGLVDVKVCAIDETWPGLKFVVRLKDRPGKRVRN
ncbi:MAG TPA: DUF3052 domain-containing protein [Candidatus Sulfotelmatobacter sp.]|nr:DUF3052 domain-containing protein [Candidatus Sulfotelmatobacter sp.]